ncbi:MAG: DNA gyrase inhibitor YacG [Gammaproteobacteria bacterium]|nr:DNA gyrase inhibitor YacG [Gammaproteobacteria bacterium]MDH5693989.1 DNA gyrase inhibitor YacG [Gammaproteobacteria bacterium]
MSLTVKCPTCSQTVAWLPSSKYRPFCSERCKLIDLGAWANEEYSVNEYTQSFEGGMDIDLSEFPEERE